MTYYYILLHTYYYYNYWKTRSSLPSLIHTTFQLCQIEQINYQNTRFLHVNFNNKQQNMKTRPKLLLSTNKHKETT